MQKILQDEGLAISVRATILNMDSEYPNKPFTVAVLLRDRSNLSYKPEAYLQGKKICVTAKIKEYKGKAEMIVDKQEQVTI